MSSSSSSVLLGTASPLSSLHDSGCRGGDGLPLFSCPDCTYKTSSMRKLGRHRSVNHAGTRYVCQQCDFVTGYQSNFYRHRKQVHNGTAEAHRLHKHASYDSAAVNNGAVALDLSGAAKEISDRTASPRHPVAATAESYPCKECGIELGTRNEWQMHWLVMHGAAAAMSFSMAGLNGAAAAAAFFGAYGFPPVPVPPPTIFPPAGAMQQALGLLANCNGAQSWSCERCKVHFVNKSQWQEHQRTYHKPLTPNVVTHIETKTKPCRAPTTVVVDVPCNGAVVTEKEPQQPEDWICKECGEDFENKSALDDHRRDAHDVSNAAAWSHTTDTDRNRNSVENGLNDALTIDENCIEDHVESAADTPQPAHRFVRNYTCPYPTCDHSTRESRDHLHHMRDAHGEHIAIFYCDQCTYASKCQAKIRRHQSLIHANDPASVRTHGSGRSIRHGNERSATAALRRRSVDVVVEPSPHTVVKSEEAQAAQLYHCPECKYHTSDWLRYKKHRRCHETTAPTACTLCDFTTVYSWNLDRHLRCHRSSGLYTCLRCSYSQNTRQSMSFHVQHHHVVATTEAECQTLDDWDALLAEGTPACVEVGHETYIFEQHAVHINQVADALDLEELDDKVGASSPLPALAQGIVGESREHSPTSSGFDTGKRQPTLDELVTAARVRNTAVATEAKYLSEQEVIESPRDASTMKDYEKDPDVKRRTCSICGYQGKWISEMVRHKRVHTNERPFKCKYCSRTSKWKADLIRHVAKVHGVRVVSKYSRSRTFDSDSQKMRAMKEAHGFLDGNVLTASDAESGNDEFAKSPFFGTDSALAIDNEASDEDEPIDDLEDSPADTSLSTLAAVALAQENEWIHQRNKASSIDPEDNAVLPMQSPSPSLTSFSRTSTPSSPKDAGRTPYGQNAVLQKYMVVIPKETGETVLKCRICPYETRDTHTFRAHTQKHENKKPYQCSTCGYRSNWSSDVHKHIRLKKIGHDNAYVVKLAPDEQGASSEGKLSPTDSLGSSVGGRRSANGGSILGWQCLKCPYEHESRADVIGHLSRVHNLPAYACRVCNFSSMYRKTCIYHMQSVHGSTEEDIVENLTSDCRRSPSSTEEMVGAKLGGQEPKHSPYEATPPASKRAKLDLHADYNGHGDHAPCKQSSLAIDTSANLELHRKEHGVRSPVSLWEDFSAIINAAAEDMSAVTGNGTENNGVHENALTLMQKKLFDAHFHADALARSDDAESDVGDDFLNEGDTVLDESYIHVGEGEDLDTHGGTFREIQKVVIVINGQSRRMWQCRHCPHVSKRRANVRLHELKHFKTKVDGMLKCPKCSFKGDKRALNVHFRMHWPGDPDSAPQLCPCVRCPALFRRQEDLVAHMRFHGAREPIKCAVCDYAVAAQAHMDKHMTLHVYENNKRAAFLANGHTDVATNGTGATVAKLTPCANGSSPSLLSSNIVPSLIPSRYSAASFDALNSISKHVPSKPKKHGCSECPARFSDRSQLARHQHFHSVRLKLRCPLCSYTVSFPINLTKHLKSHHGLNGTAFERCLQEAKVDMADADADCTADEFEHDSADEPLAAASLKIKINLGKVVQ